MDANLYWKAVPLLLRGERGEERLAPKTVRLIAGQDRGAKVLRIYISDEADPFALHVLEVGEEEYALLRADQGIRVDYANFPGKLIGLLDKCIACQGEDLPRFQAVLHTGPGAPGSSGSGAAAPSSSSGSAGPATFRVVENNDFKQLAHISLAFRGGSDAAVKQFLAFRLGELRTDCSQLSSELERTQSERNSLQTSLGEAKRALAAAREVHERHLLEHQAELKSCEAAAAEARTREVAELRDAAARERETLEARLREQLEAVQARAGEAEADARALREQKYALDARVSELSHKLGAAEGSNRALTDEVERLRSTATSLGREKAERDVELGEALTKVAALEDKVAGQQGLAAEQGQRMRDMEASLRQVEARADELKAAAQGHEARAAEAAADLAKAQTSLERLGNELQLQKEKVRRKAAIVARQEEELVVRDAAADEAGQRARGLQRDLERATEDAETLRKEVGELRGRLEDSRAQVASNEQMIRWLNNQITETQLHYSAGTTGLMTSRYSYRPPAPVPPAGSGSSATASAAPGAAAAASGLPAPGALAAGYGGALRPAVSTYRTPGTVTSVGATSGPPPPSVGSTAPPGSIGSSMARAPGGGFRSNFYATHFGGGTVANVGAGGGMPTAAGAPAARSLDLGGAGAGTAAPQAASAVPTAISPAVGPATAPSAAVAAPLATAKYLTSRFEAPTFRMADTATGRVAVPVTSGS